MQNSVKELCNKKDARTLIKSYKENFYLEYAEENSNCLFNEQKDNMNILIVIKILKKSYNPIIKEQVLNILKIGFSKNIKEI